MKAEPSVNRNFGEDVRFLAEHLDPVVLEQEDGAARILIAPAFQGRVMTSTAAGETGTSFGWMNYDLIRSGAKQPHIHVFGGEDRFWLGPEGGQYAIFFEPGTPFDFDHWQTPEAIDTAAYAIESRSTDFVTFRHEARVRNWSGFSFDIGIHRKLDLLDRERIAQQLNIQLSADLPVVGYQSENRLTNTGPNGWVSQSGLLSIWILGMFKPSDATTILLPIRPGAESDLGPRVNAAYFGPVPPERLVVDEELLYYLGDGKERGKIGVSPARARPICGSYDPVLNTLTVVQFTLPEDVQDKPYINSMWQMQKEPFRGDVVNAYNDGPPTPGAAPLGPFYELESSSPALALACGESATHIHRTYHFQGTPEQLNPIAQAVFGVGIEAITAVFSPKA